MWGLDHLSRSLLPPETPLWTGRVNFPDGALIVVLPWFSGILAAPFGWLFGPVVGWNLGVAMLLWLAGLSTAWVVWATSRSPLAGFVAGCGMMVQPLLLHAAMEGTLEHIAIWGIGVFLVALLRLVDTCRWRWGCVAGFSAVIVALDSPYHAVYTAVAGIGVVSWSLLFAPARHEIRAILRAALPGVVVAAVGLGLLAAIYGAFPIDENAGQDPLLLRRTMAADLHQWWVFDFGSRGSRSVFEIPSLIPTSVLAVSLGLALCAPRHSAPWLMSASITVVLSFGLNDNLPGHLTTWFGRAGGLAGQAVLALNSQLYDLPGIGHIRFPRRWLVPAGLCLMVAGGTGLTSLLGRIRSRLAHRPLLCAAVVAALSAALVAGALREGVRVTRFHDPFPTTPLPHLTFVEWIAEHPDRGAVLTLPQWRPGRHAVYRHELPVYANLSGVLRSADHLFFQAMHGRDVVRYPQLMTVRARPHDPAVEYLVRDWQDLADPVLRGISTAELIDRPRDHQRLQTTIDTLLQQGLRFVVLDLSVYEDTGLRLLREQLGPRLVEERTFADGEGVLVMRLAAPG